MGNCAAKNDDKDFYDLQYKEIQKEIASNKNILT